MKKNILILTGDNLGISNNQIEWENIEILKYPVIINDREYRESDEYTAQYLIDRFKKEKASAHSQALVKGDMIDVIEANKDKYDVIIHVIMGSNMSSATFQTAESVKKEYENIVPIINIDTKQVISGVGTILLRLIKILKDTQDTNELCKTMDVIVKNTFSLLCLPDLNYLYRGGRIGKAKSLLGSVLKIIPVVGLFGDDWSSGIVPIGKGRTPRTANKIIIEKIKQKMLKNKVETIKLITILDYEDNKSPALQDLENQIKTELRYEKLIHGHPRLVEAIHTGPGAWAASFTLK